jgi:hypothetical protein
MVTAMAAMIKQTSTAVTRPRGDFFDAPKVRKIRTNVNPRYTVRKLSGVKYPQPANYQYRSTKPNDTDVTRRRRTLLSSCRGA